VGGVLKPALHGILLAFGLARAYHEWDGLLPDTYGWLMSVPLVVPYTTSLN